MISVVHSQRHAGAGLADVADIGGAIGRGARGLSTNGGQLGPALQRGHRGPLGGVAQVHGPVTRRARSLGVVHGEALAVGALAVEGGGRSALEVGHVGAHPAGDGVAVGRRARPVLGGAARRPEAVHGGLLLAGRKGRVHGVGAGGWCVGPHPVWRTARRRELNCFAFVFVAVMREKGEGQERDGGGGGGGE